MATMREKARALGLERLADAHLPELERAMQWSQRQLERLPRDLPPAQESALIFRVFRAQDEPR
jgi:hypothetical protein